MENEQEGYDIVIVGAGISGTVLAERYANALGRKVLLVEKRDHLGGNCYDHLNSIGIRVSDYGPHYFRTNDSSIWEYVKKFSTWEKFEAHCLSHVGDKKVPIPVNIDTINILFNENLQSEKDAEDWFKKETIDIPECKNSEESALRRVGKRLYEKMFKNYTIKQWDKEPKELDPSVMDRIPVRYNHDSRYFTDSYQAYPIGGYAQMFDRMLTNKNISIKTNTRWEEIKDEVIKKGYKKLFFTGTIDSYFDYEFGHLEYRSLKFEEENIDKEFFQDVVQENYPEEKFSFTRIVEYKHQTKQKSPQTTIIKEYPTWEGEPYYPVPTQDNEELYQKYEKMALELNKKNVYFVGRLANYKYFNMDQAFRNALNLFSLLENNNPAK